MGLPEPWILCSLSCKPGPRSLCNLPQGVFSPLLPGSIDLGIDLLQRTPSPPQRCLSAERSKGSRPYKSISSAYKSMEFNLYTTEIWHPPFIYQLLTEGWLLCRSYTGHHQDIGIIIMMLAIKYSYWVLTICHTLYIDSLNSSSKHKWDR